MTEGETVSKLRIEGRATQNCPGMIRNSCNKGIKSAKWYLLKHAAAAKHYLNG